MKSKVGEGCRECTERFLGCHDVCATYLKAKAERMDELEQIRQIKLKDKPYEEYHLKAINHTLRKKKIEGR